VSELCLFRTADAAEKEGGRRDGDDRRKHRGLLSLG